MADMRVKVAGVEFANPLIAASGTFGFGHEYQEFYPLSTLGGISCKGITLQERPGNPPPRIAETPGGMLNAVGLQNPGVDHFIKTTCPGSGSRGRWSLPILPAILRRITVPWRRSSPTQTWT